MLLEIISYYVTYEVDSCFLLCKLTVHSFRCLSLEVPSFENWKEAVIWNGGGSYLLNRAEHGGLGSIFMHLSVSFLLTIKSVTRLRGGQWQGELCDFLYICQSRFFALSTIKSVTIFTRSTTRTTDSRHFFSFHSFVLLISSCDWLCNSFNKTYGSP